MSIQVMFPYNPNATLEECKLSGESHSLRTSDNTYRVIVPELAPFFETGLIVKFAANREVLTLVQGRDYELGYKVLSAKSIANEALYGCIVITNPSLFGEFIIDYQTVGGSFVGIRSNVLTFLANVLVDPVKTPFERVIDRPAYYVPHKHEQHWADFLNKDGIADSIDSLAESIQTAIEKSDSEAIAYLNGRIDQIDSLLDQFSQDDHIVNESNPHRVSHVQAGALSKTAAAVDTLKAYSMTLADLADFINDRGITQEDINRYVHLYGDQRVYNRIKLTNGQAQIRTESSRTIYDLNDGNFKLQGNAVAGIFANNDFTAVSEHARIESGANVLEVQSSGNDYEIDKLLFNGEEVLHVGNARDKLVTHGGSGVRIVSSDTDSIVIVGSSRPSSPLRATVALYTATLTRRGTVMYSTSRTDRSTTKAATGSVLNDIRLSAVNKALNTIKINNQPLTADVNITPSSIGLGNVNNTRDIDKPVSTPQRELLNRYSLKTHRHDTEGYEFPLATPTVKGIVRLVDTVDNTEHFHSVATPFIAKALHDYVVETSNRSADRIGTHILPISYWSTPGPATINGWRIALPENAGLFMNGVDYELDPNLSVPGYTVDLQAEFGGAQVNRTIFFYIDVDSGVPRYSVSLELKENTPTSILIFRVAGGVSSVVDVDIPGYANVVGGVLITSDITSVGMFRELEEHISSNFAHLANGQQGDPSKIGLDLILNQRALDDVSWWTHREMAKWTVLDGTATFTPVTASVAGGAKEVATKVNVTRAGSATCRLVANVEKHNRAFYHQDGTTSALVRENWWRFQFPRETHRPYQIEMILGEKDGETLSLVAHTAETTVSNIDLYRNYGRSNQRKLWSYADKFYTAVAESFYVGLHQRMVGDEITYKVSIQRENPANKNAAFYDVSFLWRENDAVISVNAGGYVSGVYQTKTHNSTVQYGDGSVSNLLEFGDMGFGFIGTNAMSEVLVTHFFSEEGDGDEQYLSAEALKTALGEGLGVTALTGTVSGTYGRIPLPMIGAEYDVSLGVKTLGSQSVTSTSPLDGVRVRIHNYYTNEDFPVGAIDCRSINRHCSVTVAYKEEKDGATAPLSRNGDAFYMLLVKTHT